MRFRWPLMWRSTHYADRDDRLHDRDVLIAEKDRRIRELSHLHDVRLDEIARLGQRVDTLKDLVAANDRVNGSLKDFIEELKEELHESVEALNCLRGEFRRCHAELTAIKVDGARRHEVLWASGQFQVQARDRIIDGLRAELTGKSSGRVGAFWLGLPNEILNLVVTTNHDGLQATLGGPIRDDKSDDPRHNMTKAFGIRPL